MTEESGDLPGNGRLLAIDWGKRRIGLAVSDPSQTLAQPLDTLTRRIGKRFPFRGLRPHLDRLRPVGILLGLPLRPDGSEGEYAQEVRRLADQITNLTGLPTAFWDERMTTSRALEAVKQLGGGLKGRKGELDALAATNLLQSYLDRREFS